MDYIIYRDILINEDFQYDSFLKTFRSKPPDFFRERVRSLCVYTYIHGNNMIQDTIAIIEACSELRSLLWFIPVEEGDALSPNLVTNHFQLQTLSLLDFNREFARALSFDASYHSWRQSVLVLDISGPAMLEIDFRVFPNLTIISLCNRLGGHLSIEKNFSSTLAIILAQNPLLECLVLGVDHDHSADVRELKHPQDFRNLRSQFDGIDTEDPRLVVLPVFLLEDWDDQVTGRWSYWDLAKSVVQMQRDAITSETQ
jgi:hypothetical protein